MVLYRDTTTGSSGDPTLSHIQEEAVALDWCFHSEAVLPSEHGGWELDKLVTNERTEP